jgi:hypothetical protein
MKSNTLLFPKIKKPKKTISLELEVPETECPRDALSAPTDGLSAKSHAQNKVKKKKRTPTPVSQDGIQEISQKNSEPARTTDSQFPSHKPKKNHRHRLNVQSQCNS